ncbi:MAG: pantetheine-phosphate adenylyltransferase [Firmicutes bacterium]|jgi:pantetheine-phosphate adenylyltransferase|nr:pantetheine-phosphate adenylyltransferase [Bacillota bacterium]
MRRAICPGSFDPVTNGHIDIIRRASKVVDHLTVAVLDNPRKKGLFTFEERMKMLKSVTRNYRNIEIDSFRGLLVDYARQKEACIIIKGLRAISDFEFEFQMALINNKLDPRLETMFMMTSSKYAYLSSSIVKEVACFGGDISAMVPEEVHDFIIKKINTSTF